MTTVTVSVPFNTTLRGAAPDYRTTEVIDYVYPGPDGYSCTWDTTKYFARGKEYLVY